MMEQMKVLQIGLGFNPGGMESFIMTYYRELQECGVHSLILLLCFLILHMKKKYRLSREDIPYL